MNINIIIPVLNEQDSIFEKISSAVNFLNSTPLKNSYCLTIIDNGSTDNTQAIATSLVNQFNNIVYYVHLNERGVGLAFREGIKHNSFDIVGYMDLDLATDLKHVIDVYNTFIANKDASIVVGSRLLKSSKVIGRSLIRTITSVGLNTILKVFLGVKFSDAMCGFKFYRKEIAEKLINECSNNNGWFYCAEMMIRAEWLNIHINEIPVVWTDDPNSKVKIFKLIINYLKDIFYLRKEKKNYLKSH